MAKTYFNSAITGNSRMLGCMSERGELLRLFWPNIDYQQHIDRMYAGVFIPAKESGTLWLHSEYWECSQNYIEDTNILRTVFRNYMSGLHIIQTDFVLPYDDVLVRNYRIENKGDGMVDAGFIVYAALTSDVSDLRCVLFDFKNDSMIFYRHNQYISISTEHEVFQFQAGNNAFEAASQFSLKGYDSIGMMHEGALSWKLGCLNQGGTTEITICISASSTLEGVKKLTGKMKKADKNVMYERTAEYWRSFLRNAVRVSTDEEDIDRLYRRSLLVFDLMSDKNSGGLLAAPEIDEEFTRCGRYAYCWGRDAAFITEALDKCGLYNAVEKFYQWAAAIQGDDGSWQQRYYVDGNLAPSWGLQVDETGSIIWGIHRHYEITRDKGFLQSMWESVYRGAEFLLGYIDHETGLPFLSYDIWEERYGEHAYSSAAVYGGICAGAEIARILEFKGEAPVRWKRAAEELRAAIERNFWKEEKNRFIRSVRTKMNPWGEEHSPEKIILRVNSMGYVRDFTPEDDTADISLLGLCIPFGVFGVDDTKITNTVRVIEEVLSCREAGGIKRYENDSYIGGNPWILATLWLASYYVKKMQMDKAMDYFKWAVRSRTSLDLLPEQVDRQTSVGYSAYMVACDVCASAF